MKDYLDINIVDEDLSPLLSTLLGFDVDFISLEDGIHIYEGHKKRLLVYTPDKYEKSVREAARSNIIILKNMIPYLTDKSFSMEGMIEDLKDYMRANSHQIQLNNGFIWVIDL